MLAGAVLVEMALAAGSELWPDHPVELQHFDILAPTVIEGDGVRIRTEVDLATGNIIISRRPRLTRTDWLIVARGVLRRGVLRCPPRPDLCVKGFCPQMMFMTYWPPAACPMVPLSGEWRPYPREIAARSGSHCLNR